MVFTCLSNKKSPAPLLYLLLQIISLAALVYYCPAIVSFKEHPETVLFWLNVFIVITFYFNAHLRDPGYVPHDAIFFTDQEPSAVGGGLRIKRRMDSITAMKSKAKRSPEKAKELISTTDHETKERIPETLTINMRSGIESERRTNANSTNNLCPTNFVTETPHHAEKKIDIHEIFAVRPDQEEAGEAEDGRADEENSKLSSKEDEEKQDAELVECEHSLEEEDSPDPDHIIDFNRRSKTDVETLDNMGSPLKVRLAKSEEKKGVSSSPNLNKGSRADDGLEVQGKEERQEENYQQYQKRLSLDININGNYQYTPEKGADVENESENKNSTGLRKLFTKEVFKAQVKSTVHKKRDYFAFNDEESSVAQGNDLTQKEISSMNLKRDVSRPFVDQSQEGGASLNATRLTHKEMLKKKTHRRQDSTVSQSREIMLVSKKFDEYPEMDDLEKQKENKDDLLYVERRYCTVCDVEQPLRAKHCKECNKCVAQYDHHCPWLGTCIGEKNHLPFYWFLIFQLIEILWGDFKVFHYMFTMEYTNWASENAGRIILATIITFFLIMLVSLVCFHTYLAFVNQTTWETLSWYKISYLREWHEDWGSPFSEGIVKNLRFFCCTKKEQLRRWTMPKYKRPLNEQ